MTNRHSGYVIVLKDDIREDDAEAVITALKMIKGVLSVQPIVNGANTEEIITTFRVNDKWRDKLTKLIQEMR
jgi:hypothetical protein